MASQQPALPPVLKPLQKFLNAAQFWKTRDAVIAYFCRLQALELGIGQFGKDPSAKPFLVFLLQGVEQEKKELAGHEALADPFVGQTQVLNVANKLFELADSQDRAGAADATTARLFANFIVLCDVFKGLKGEDSQLEERHQYARFKATDIAKCLREGRTPQPGPPGEGAAAEALPSSDPSFLPDPPGAASWQPGPPTAPTTALPPPPAAAFAPSMGLPPALPPNVPPYGHLPSQAQPLPSLQPPGPPLHAPSASPSLLPGPPSTFPSRPPPPSAQSGLAHAQPPHAVPPFSGAPAAAPLTSPSSSRPVAVGGSGGGTAGGAHHSMDALKLQDQAAKHCKFAISALQYSDVATAISNLEAALRCLRQ